MRIAAVNWTCSRAGGVETYLGVVLPALGQAGHDVALGYEMAVAGRDAIPLPTGAPLWQLAGRDAKGATAALRDWRPDVIFAQGLLDSHIEAELVSIAPMVLFAHSYYGTCVSGGKTFKAPTPVPCSRHFGPGCLIHYYPHRCGGLNPLTMWTDYGLQSARLQTIRACRAVITASEHMRREYLRHGLPDARVHRLPFPLAVTPLKQLPPSTSRPRRLLFAGRMDLLKGGQVLLDALPSVARRLGNLELVMAGDGPERAALEHQVKSNRDLAAAVSIRFTGWLRLPDLLRVYDQSDLLVMPSLWPEPFGQVGLEAGTRGLPCTAFATGGIPEWLIEGVNGTLAPATPPTAAGLAAAIERALADPAQHGRLRSGALAAAARFDPAGHVAALNEVLERAVTRG